MVTSGTQARQTQPREDPLSGRAARTSLYGISPAAPLHFGIDSAILAQFEAVEAGYEHTILFADLHLMMSHNMSFPEVRRRSYYYEAAFSAAYGIEARFLRGSDFQTSETYMSRLLTMATAAKIKACSNASPVEPKFLSDVMYPLMQCLDALFLGVDLVVADTGQRRIYRLIEGRGGVSENSTPVLNGAQPFVSAAAPDFEYHDLPVDILGRPLRDSTTATRITIHESSASLAKKVKRMYAPPPGQEPDPKRENALLSYLKYSVFPWRDGPLVVQTSDGAISLEQFSDAESAFLEGRIHPGDFKEPIFECLKARCLHFREHLANAPDSWIDHDRLQTV